MMMIVAEEETVVDGSVILKVMLKRHEEAAVAEANHREMKITMMIMKEEVVHPETMMMIMMKRMEEAVDMAVGLVIRKDIQKVPAEEAVIVDGGVHQEMRMMITMMRIMIAGEEIEAVTVKAADGLAILKDMQKQQKRDGNIAVAEEAEVVHPAMMKMKEVQDV